MSRLSLCAGTCVVALYLGTGIAQARTEPADAESGDRADILVIGQRDTLTMSTTTGSRLGLTPLETPASIASLAGDTIRARGDMNVVDAVTRAPGITSFADPGNGGTALAARGFSGQGSVLQLVDGFRLFPVAGTITFPTDPWNVERIEVLSGPASVLYGQGALGGAVNIVTKSPDPEHTTIDAAAGYGSQDTWHLAAGIGGPVASRLSYRFDASYRHSKGYVDRGRSQSLALSGALRFEATETLALTLRNDYGDTHPTRYFGTPLIAGRIDPSIRARNYNVSDADMHFRDNRLTLTLDWEIAHNLILSNATYWLKSKRLFRNLEEYVYDTDSGLIDRSSNLGIVHDQNQYGDQSSVKWSSSFAGLANDLVVGFDLNLIKLTYSHDFGSDPQEDSVDPRTFNPGLFFDTQGIAPRYRTRTVEYSIFAEDRLKLSDALSIVGGVRAEWDEVQRRNIVYAANGSTSEVSAFPGGVPSRTLDNITWRVGAVYQPTSKVSLYGQYATGVDPLGTLTTFTTNATQFFFTNATGNQIEAGAKASFLGGRGSATIAAYRIVKNNLVAQRTPTSPIEQIGQRSTKGIETSVAVTLAGGFAFDANGTLLDARFDDFISGGTSFTGKTPPGIAEAAANMWLSWSSPANKFQLRGGLRYVGDRFSDNANRNRVPGYVTIDSGLSYAITKSIAVSFQLYNLLDKNYATTTYTDDQWILGRPRSVDVSVSARF